MTEEEADTVLKIADENGDGVLDYDELIALVNKGDSGLLGVRRTSVPTGKVHGREHPHGEHVSFSERESIM